MPNFSKHIGKFKSNFSRLEKSLIDKTGDYYDWEVTYLFYAALHLIHAHIDNKISKHPKTHNDVTELIDCRYSNNSKSKLDKETFNAYSYLQDISRVGRYFSKPQDPSVSVNVDKRDFITAIEGMDIVLKYMSSSYPETFKNQKILEIDGLEKSLNYFKKKGN